MAISIQGLKRNRHRRDNSQPGTELQKTTFYLQTDKRIAADRTLARLESLADCNLGHGVLYETLLETSPMFQEELKRLQTARQRTAGDLV